MVRRCRQVGAPVITFEQPEESRAAASSAGSADAGGSAPRPADVAGGGSEGDAGGRAPRQLEDDDEVVAESTAMKHSWLEKPVNWEEDEDAADDAGTAAADAATTSARASLGGEAPERPGVILVPLSDSDSECLSETEVVLSPSASASVASEPVGPPAHLQRLIRAAVDAASQCGDAVKTWVGQAKRSAELETGPDVSTSLRIVLPTVVFRRAWQAKWAVTINCLLAWQWRAHVTMYVTVMEDEAGSHNGLLAFLHETCAAAVECGLLVLGKGTGSNYWHASIMKNAAHVFALATENATAGGRAPLCADNVVIVNVDADNIMGIGFIRAIITAFEGCQREPVCAVCIGEVPGTTGRIACWGRHFVELMGYDESFLPSGYQDMDLRDRVLALQLTQLGWKHLRRIRTPDAVGTAIPNDLHDRKNALGQEKVRYCDPLYARMTWHQMNGQNSDTGKAKSKLGLLVRNGHAGDFLQLGLPVTPYEPCPEPPEVPPDTRLRAGGSAPHGEMAKRPRHQVPTPVSEVQVRIFTFGVELLGLTHWQSAAANDLVALAQGRGRGRGHGPEIPSQVVTAAFSQIGLLPPDETLLAIDCRGFADPQRILTRVNHIGAWPQHVQSFVAHREFRPWLLEARRRIRAELQSGRVVLNIATFCKKGRHRSVAGALLLRHCLEQAEGAVVITHRHLADPFWCRYTCDNCFECRELSPVRSAAMSQALVVWRQ